MIDNFRKIRSLLHFEGGNFIHLFIKARYKDQAMTAGFHSWIKDYFFGSMESLEAQYDNLKTAADAGNARIYISLNAEALSEPYKAQLSKNGVLFGDKQLYGIAEGTPQYLLYDADRGREAQSARVLETLTNAGLLIDRIPTVTGESFIFSPCDCNALFGSCNHVYIECFPMLYYGQQG